MQNRRVVWMFDEIDEGTAIMKVMGEPPAGEVLRGEIPNAPEKQVRK